MSEYIDKEIFDGASIRVTKKNKLKKIIADIMNSKYEKLLKEGREQAIARNVYKFDGKSSSRVFDIIKGNL